MIVNRIFLGVRNLDFLACLPGFRGLPRAVIIPAISGAEPNAIMSDPQHGTNFICFEIISLIEAPLSSNNFITLRKYFFLYKYDDVFRNLYSSQLNYNVDYHPYNYCPCQNGHCSDHNECYCDCTLDGHANANDCRYDDWSSWIALWEAGS